MKKALVRVKLLPCPLRHQLRDRRCGVLQMCVIDSLQVCLLRGVQVEREEGRCGLHA